MISPVTGKLIHHNDCTWCRHRVVYKKALNKGKNELEVCDLRGPGSSPLPHPSTGARYCERYSQIGCDCPRCKENEPIP